MDWTQADGFDAGCRFYLGYAGSAPTAGNCATLATDVSTAYGTWLAPMIQDLFTLTEVDVLDIATDSGLSGQWHGTVAGANSGGALPAQSAMNIEFGIARRYRGGKPRIFLPPASTAQQQDAGHWTTAWAASMSTNAAGFFAALEALSIGAMGALSHVNLSYYKGFTNITNSSGRERAVPTYRATALVDTITSYAGKTLIGSQRRRRNATNP